MSRKRKTQRQKIENPVWIEHVDYKWFENKVEGHGGSLGYSSRYGLAHIGYIGHKNAVQVFVYNIILFFKYLKRVIRKRN